MTVSFSIPVDTSDGWMWGSGIEVEVNSQSLTLIHIFHSFASPFIEHYRGRSCWSVRNLYGFVGPSLHNRQTACCWDLVFEGWNWDWHQAWVCFRLPSHIRRCPEAPDDLDGVLAHLAEQDPQQRLVRVRHLQA